jgi:hypothetical protein
VGTHSTHLFSDDGCYCLGQVRFPSAGQTDDLWEDCRAARHKTTATFLVDHGWDTQARILRKESLDGVCRLRDLGWCE